MGETQTTVRQAVMGDNEVQQLIEKLEKMPKWVQDARDNLNHAEFQLSVFNEHELAKEKVEELQLETDFEVANEVGENGKKKHSNQEQRKAASVITLSKSQEYIDAKNKLIQAKRTKAEFEMNVGKLRNQFFFTLDDFKAHVAIAGLIQGLCHDHQNAELMQHLYKQKDKLATIINQLKEGLSDV